MEAFLELAKKFLGINTARTNAVTRFDTSRANARLVL
jgi:hypothetical protein